MSKNNILPAEILFSWRAITVLTALFFALQVSAAGPFFRPVENRWTLSEDLRDMKRPAHPGAAAAAAGLSAEGTVIGVGGPGWGRWDFSAPGPLPTTIVPFFLPPDGSRSGIFLLTGNGGRVPLIENTPLRDRALNFRDKVKGLGSYSVRFEGTGALLSSVKFLEPLETGGSDKGLFLALFCLALVFTRGLVLREKHTAALAVITAAALFLRWSEFSAYWDVPLTGDAEGYWNYGRALKLSAPFANGTREPLFIWLLKLFETLFGDSQRTARFMTLLFSCSVVPMTWLLAKRLELGAFASLLAAALAAFNPFAVFMSVQGYQLEFFTFLILVFSVLWLSVRLAASGAAGAALILTRLQSAGAVFPLAALAAWRQKKVRPKKVPASFLQRTIPENPSFAQKGGWHLFLRLFLPPLIALAVLLASAKVNTGSYTGNLDHAARAHTALDRHGDFSSGKGAEEMTLGKYLLSREGTPRLALRTVKGYFQILANPFNPFNRIFLNSHYSKAWNLLLFPFLWLGLWVFFSDPGRRAFLWLPLLFLSALPALQDQYREPRQLFHAAPFFFVLCAAGVRRALQAVRVPPPPPTPLP